MDASTQRSESINWAGYKQSEATSGIHSVVLNARIENPEFCKKNGFWVRSDTTVYVVKVSPGHGQMIHHVFASHLKPLYDSTEDTISW